MPFNGSGVFSPPSANYPAVANTLIEAADRNAIDSDIATGLSTCITKDGQTVVTANIPMAGFRFTGLGAGASAGQSLRYEQLFTTSAVQLLGAMDWVKGADIASATTLNLTTATGNGVHVTGTTTITGVTLGSGMWRLVIFDGALTLTHHATNNNLPGASNITTAAGDRALYWSDGTTVYCVNYIPVANSVVEPVGFTTGDVKLTIKTTADTGWVLMNDGTIGNGSSGGTTRANADTEDLFLLLYANTADAQCAVSGGRTGNAANDYAANKTIALPKALGRALATYGAGSGLTSRVLALATGSEDAVVVAHTHTGAQASTGANPTAGAATSNAIQYDASASTGSTGVSGTGANMQPTLFLNVMIKL